MYACKETHPDPVFSRKISSRQWNSWNNALDKKLVPRFEQIAFGISNKKHTYEYLHHQQKQNKDNN